MTPLTIPINHLTRWQAQTWQPKPSATWSSSDRDSLTVPSLSVPGDQDRQPSPSSLRGRLQSLRRATSPARSKTSQSPEGLKGALGLTLIHEPSEPRVDFIFVCLHGPRPRTKLTASGSWPEWWIEEVMERFLRPFELLAKRMAAIRSRF